jgi:hypothetical protein
MIGFKLLLYCPLLHVNTLTSLVLQGISAFSIACLFTSKNGLKLVEILPTVGNLWVKQSPAAVFRIRGIAGASGQAKYYHDDVIISIPLEPSLGVCRPGT